MDTKKTIRKILLVGIWLAVGTGMTVLLLAAIGKQQREICKGFDIAINGIDGQRPFIDKYDVVKLMRTAANGDIKGQSRKAIDLKHMEKLLQGNMWVKEVRVYFDNQDMLHVSIRERQPLARIFTTAGKSFYLDEDARIMQLSDRVSARLPVFTDYPERKNPMRSDSSLKADIISTAKFISADPFWSAQVAQLDIVADNDNGWEFDMVPLVGNHLVRLGSADSIERKFARLFVFYKEVLSKTGFDKYKTVDVRFAGQVVAARSANPKVDQAQLKKSVETLLKQIKEAEMLSDAEAAKLSDAEIRAEAEKKTIDAKDQASDKATILPNAVDPPGEADDAPVKPANIDNKTPRAVMPKQTGNKH